MTIFGGILMEAGQNIVCVKQYPLSSPCCRGRMSTRVTSKGQAAIPKTVRDFLGIGPGSRVEYRRIKDGSGVSVLPGFFIAPMPRLPA